MSSLEKIFVRLSCEISVWKGDIMDDPVYKMESIEKMRDTLHKLAIAKGITDPDVLAVSRVLDQQISKYLRQKNLARSDNAGQYHHHEKLS